MVEIWSAGHKIHDWLPFSTGVLVRTTLGVRARRGVMTNSTRMFDGEIPAKDSNQAISGYDKTNVGQYFCVPE